MERFNKAGNSTLIGRRPRHDGEDCDGAGAEEWQGERVVSTAEEARQEIPDRPMTTLAKLLKEKRQLLERLQEDPSPNERAEIERLMAQIEEELNLLDDAGPGTSKDRQE